MLELMVSLLGGSLSCSGVGLLSCMSVIAPVFNRKVLGSSLGAARDFCGELAQLSEEFLFPLEIVLGTRDSNGCTFPFFCLFSHIAFESLFQNGCLVCGGGSSSAKQIWRW